MKHSCGALLYTFHPYTGELGIVLGYESGHWLPFKGGAKEGETLEQAAIREVYEETCGLLNPESIILEHNFSSKTKHYHLGICEAPYEIIDQFEDTRRQSDVIDMREKTKLQYFSLSSIIDNKVELHSLARASINFFMDKLNLLNQYRKVEMGIRSRCLKTQDVRRQRSFGTLFEGKQKREMWRRSNDSATHLTTHITTHLVD